MLLSALDGSPAYRRPCLAASRQVTGDDPGLADGHIVGIKGENLIHPFQFDDDAVIDRDSAAGTGTGRTRRNRYQVFIGQFDDLPLLPSSPEDDDFGL